jgi:formylglycine-generating enzyme required for sulfatase activity
MTAAVDDAVEYARLILRLDRNGRPACTDRERIFSAVQKLRLSRNADALGEAMSAFLSGGAQRYSEYVASLMRPIPAAHTMIGTDADQALHFVGETPRRAVALSGFHVACAPVTKGMFSLLASTSELEPSRHDKDLPIADVTWFDAAVFAMWVGCRLLTEAEWEYACGAGGAGQWCCEHAEQLPRFAWFSENSGGIPHSVGTREPNAFGLFDMHGNVWEWCQDDYSADFYAQAALNDPVNDLSTRSGATTAGTHKVQRGGSFYSLEEMCRTRFRLHDPAQYCAPDLGFRIARDWQGETRW